MAKTTLRMSYMDSFPVEIEIVSDDEDTFVNPAIVLETLKAYQLHGFGMPFQFQKKSGEKESIVGKKGVVESVSPITTKNGYSMFNVVARLEDGSAADWNEFNATTFRKGDKVTMEKNERGYIVGVAELPL